MLHRNSFLLRLAPLVLMLSACADATPVANIGVSLSPNGVRILPSVGVSGSHGSLVLHP